MAHQKHAKLTKPIGGRWSRTEVSISGAPCSEIKQLSAKIIELLATDWRIAYVDAEHNTNDDGEWSALKFGASSQITDKISHFSVDMADNKEKFLNNTDLAIVNGNHFSADCQIAWIHPNKSLEKKLDKLSNVELVILEDGISKIPEYLKQHLEEKDYNILKCTDISAIAKFLENKLLARTPLLNGLVLIGGNSSRMNSDKSQLKYHNDVVQVDYMRQLLEKYCDQVYTSVRDDIQAKSLEAQSITDKFIGLGPYGGILSAFQHNPNVAWLVVAIDLPYVDEAAIEMLLENRNIHKTATCFIDRKNEFPEPLITIWEPRAYSTLLNFLSKGYSCPRKALINSEVELITSRDPTILTNINTPGEFEETRIKISD